MLGLYVFLLNMPVQMETANCAEHEISFKMKTNYEEINTGERDVYMDTESEIETP